VNDISNNSTPDANAMKKQKLARLFERFKKDKAAEIAEEYPKLKKARKIIFKNK
jgi:hypothetical protein